MRRSIRWRRASISAPLFALMANPAVIKVFHAARQDVEIFHHLSGAIPMPLFDTQLAAMVCGYGEEVGYETLVRRWPRPGSTRARASPTGRDGR